MSMTLGAKASNVLIYKIKYILRTEGRREEVEERETEKLAQASPSAPRAGLLSLSFEPLWPRGGSNALKELKKSVCSHFNW